ncbi:hypothetical protein J6590_019186 [Homalodisca vitripennis]|nr:hypothetical protein J6590_019186 [Homalodisca vitripennis]
MSRQVYDGKRGLTSPEALLTLQGAGKDDSGMSVADTWMGERSCSCKPPICPAVGGGSEVIFKPLVPSERYLIINLNGASFPRTAHPSALMTAFRKRTRQASSMRWYPSLKSTKPSPVFAPPPSSTKMGEVIASDLQVSEDDMSMLKTILRASAEERSGIEKKQEDMYSDSSDEEC